MPSEPIVVHREDREWEAWAADQIEERGRVEWKTLLSADRTPTERLVFGVARVPPAGALNAHRHSQPEVYFVLRGEGVVTVDGAERVVSAGDSIFFPGDALHSVSCAGPEDLELAYAFPADSADEVTYIFESGD